jgi:hypothetical protein
VTDSILYFRSDEGAVKRITTSAGEDEVVPPEGMTRITVEEHDQLLAVMTEARAARVAAITADDRRRATDDFDALRACGIPEVTARRLSGLASLDAGAGVVTP